MPFSGIKEQSRLDTEKLSGEELLREVCGWSIKVEAEKRRRALAAVAQWAEAEVYATEILEALAKAPMPVVCAVHSLLCPDELPDYVRAAVLALLNGGEE